MALNINHTKCWACGRTRLRRTACETCSTKPTLGATSRDSAAVKPAVALSSSFVEHPKRKGLVMPDFSVPALKLSDDNIAELKRLFSVVFEPLAERPTLNLSQQALRQKAKPFPNFGTLTYGFGSRPLVRTDKDGE